MKAERPTPPPDSTQKHREFREVLASFVLILISVAITAGLIPGGIKEYAYSVILAAMVYLPVFRGEAHGHRLEEYGIHLKTWRKDILFALLVMLIVFPLFALGNHFWQTLVLGHSYRFSWPHENLAWLLIEQALFIALPEEFFYRGWMQTVFSRRWPSRLRILGGDFGGAIWLTSLLFAIGHLGAIFSPFRLAVFFPSLLFGWMRSRSGSLVPSILVHGASNVIMAVCVASYG